MRLFLIRHGATTTSGKTYAGREDVPLTDEGRAQARQIAKTLAAEPVSLILSSPLSRAIETARPLAQARGLDPIRIPTLMEIDFGAFEGHPKGTLGLSLRKTHARLPIPGGEALIDVWARADDVLDQLRDQPKATAAVFGHFWINRMIWGRANGLSFEESCKTRAYRPKTGSCVLIAPRPFGTRSRQTIT